MRNSLYYYMMRNAQNVQEDNNGFIYIHLKLFT